jgi:signal transduction histidine kinase
LGYYFASAYFIYFLLVLTEGIYIQIGTPGYFAEMSHVTWATLIEAIILSFLLSRRFEWEKQETEEAKIAAQKEALEKTQENERIIKEQNVLLEAKVSERTEALQKSYEDLKNTQEKLVQSEKLASLGELTAGIAHEIKNPLNFVNNFAELGNELIEEIDEFMGKEDYEEVKFILNDLKVNLDKINEHGKRADSIVKSMLLHSRSSSSTKEKTSINKLCEEYTKLAFHGYRAKDKSFTADFELQFDEQLPEDSLVNQDFGRVLLNLITNAFYAVNKKFKTLDREQRENYKPLVTVKTMLRNTGNEENLHIFIIDNGVGIPEDLQAKIFQPFFTTKPAGEGTGLGLSLVFDIIKSYQGNIEVVSKEGEGTTFEIQLPLRSFQ